MGRKLSCAGDNQISERLESMNLAHSDISDEIVDDSIIRQLEQQKGSTLLKRSA